MKNYKKNLSPLFVFLLLGTWANFANADAGNPVACTGSGTTVAEAISDSGNDLQCLTEPDIYKVKMYEMGLCTAAPTLANMATACTSVSKIPAGGLITVVKGADSAIPGTFTRPDNGVYPYGYVILSPEFRITATKKFTTELIGQGGAAGDLTLKGKTCWTLAGTYRDSVPISPADDDIANYLAKCSDLISPAPGETVTIQDAFGGGVITPAADDRQYAFIEGMPVGDAFISAYLTDSDLALADTSANVTRLVAFVTLATPATITDDSATFVTSFKVSQGSLLGYSGVDNKARMTHMGSGPFMVDISVRQLLKDIIHLNDSLGCHFF